MTTLAQVYFKCPCCGSRFTGEILCSTNILGRCTDFRPITGGIPFIFHTVQLCPNCGFTWESEEFDEMDIPDNLKDEVKKNISPEIKGEALTPQKKHVLLARIYQLMEASPLQIAGAYLHASWCCVYDDAVDEERNYRKKAIEYFKEALSAKNVVAEEERARLTYLVGELYRRTCDITNAHTWFDRVEGEIVDKEAQSLFLKLAKQQKSDPRDKLSKYELIDMCRSRSVRKENKQLRALFEKARDFFNNSPKLKAFDKNERINYKANIKGREKVILFIVHGYDSLLIGFESLCFTSIVDYNRFLAALKTTESNGITTETLYYPAASISDKTSFNELDKLLATIQSQLLNKLEAFRA